ncbi:hypothetical protein KEM54_006158 [Ascosphaera aggregata]|nr:hypothetical protein KEM54_006158 [Ascosphaera aggregata]
MSLQSPWQTLRQDESLREEICQDVDRCMQDNHYFRDPRTKRRMLDILFVYAKMNADIGYRQGMHEILAPVIWVIDSDSVGAQSETEPWEEDKTLLTTLDSRSLRAWRCGNGKPAVVNYESPIVARSRRIHEVMLFRVDYELAEHLAAIEILPQIFLTRWIRLLFGREFQYQEVLSVWDIIFAEGVRLELIDYVCVAMLLRIRWRLLETDYSGALSLLLKYPSPHPRHPRTFVSDALFLEKDPTIQGGSSIILKYSDRIPSFSGRSPPQRPNPFVTPPIDLSPFTGPRINRRLDSLFHDVSGGVAKAVKGAVVEARRNFNAAGSQHHGVTSHLKKSSSSHESGLSPSNPNAAAMAELNKRVFKLESRSKALGTMLAEALSQFRAAQKCEPRNDEGGEKKRDEMGKKDEEEDQDEHRANLSEEDIPHPIDILLAKVQFVQVYLEDPTIPIDGVENYNPDSPFTIAGSEWDKLSLRSPSVTASSPTKSSTRLPPKGITSPSSNIDASPLTGAAATTSALSPAAAATSPPTFSKNVPGMDGVAETIQPTQRIEYRTTSKTKEKKLDRATSSPSRGMSLARAPLSASPFSWMLGDSKDKKDDFGSAPFMSATASNAADKRGDHIFQDSAGDGLGDHKTLQHGRNVSLEKLGL